MGLNFSWLHHPRVRHVVQSNYAKVFLQTLGLNSRYLTDYVVLSNSVVVPEEEKVFITFNAGPKVPYDISPYLHEIGKEMGLESVPLIGMDKNSCENFLKKSVFYIDMGRNPGKDRAPREAILAGAMVFVSKVGAGQSDYMLPEYYCVDPWDINMLKVKIIKSFLNRKINLKSLQNLKEKLASEITSFETEVVDLVINEK